MAYTYTLTNHSQFKGREFQENKSDIQLKNNGVVECNEIVEGFFDKQLPDGSYWTKIFYHHLDAGVYTQSEDPRTLKSDAFKKFGRFDELNTLAYKIDGKYEFLLEFPSELPGLYNRWKQSSNPSELTPDKNSGNSGLTGYESIDIDFDHYGWNGLEYNGHTCLCDGSSRNGGSETENPSGFDNWFYAIGCYTLHNSGIPGPPINGKDSYRDIALWVRVQNNYRFIKDFYLTNDKKIYCNEFIEELN